MLGSVKLCTWVDKTWSELCDESAEIEGSEGGA